MNLGFGNSFINNSFIFRRHQDYCNNTSIVHKCKCLQGDLSGYTFEISYF